LVGDRWPILTYGSTPKFNPDVWDFTISGLVENPLRFSWEEWNELPNAEVKADMHCVTSWSKLDNVWMGVQARRLLDIARPKPEARSFGRVLRRRLHNKRPIEELYEGGCSLPTHHNGEPWSR
jgi:DMSO/TMAO reductase YedYZ molybdopterin-dependent catalytic subunit